MSQDKDSKVNFFNINTEQNEESVEKKIVETPIYNRQPEPAPVVPSERRLGRIPLKASELYRNRMVVLADDELFEKIRRLAAESHQSVSRYLYAVIFDALKDKE